MGSGCAPVKIPGTIERPGFEVLTAVKLAPVFLPAEPPGPAS